MGYAKTEAGQAAFRERSALFSVRQRAAFIMFDGVKSTEQVLAATSGLGTTPLDVEQMVTHGFLRESAGSGTPVAVAVESRGPVPALPALPAVSAAAAAQSASPLPSATPTAPIANAVPVSTRTPQERYSRAKPLATQLTASLGLRGFLLNLGVESASGYDELLALLPKIQSAVGEKKCSELERILKS